MKRQKNIRLQTVIVFFGGLMGVGLIVVLVLFIFPSPRATAPIKDRLDKLATSQSESSVKFDKNQFSIDQPGSIWWIVNKTRPVGESYRPDDLVTPNVSLNTQKSQEENQIRSQVAMPLQRLFEATQQEGIQLFLASGYRSFSLQQTYYNNYVRTSGQVEADRFSARPGTSEHQTGLSLDVATSDRVHYLDQAFGEDAAGKWIKTHAHEYGFIVRYPEGKEAITGYLYEPWHLRYVGTDLANELYRNNQTMEEFFNL